MNGCFHQNMFDFVEKVCLVFYQRIFPNWMRVTFFFLARKCDIVDKSKHILKKCFESFEVSVSTRVGLEFCVRSCMALLKSAKFVYIPSLSPM